MLLAIESGVNSASIDRLISDPATLRLIFEFDENSAVAIAAALFFVVNSCKAACKVEPILWAFEGEYCNQSQLMTNENRELELAIGFDPGRDKCGIARVKLPSRSRDQAQDRGQVLNTDKAFGAGITIDQMRVVESASAIADVVAQCQKFPIATIVMGDGTSSKYWRTQLEQALPDTVALVTVNEYNSTQEARDRYWILHPSRGLSRIIPAKLRSIPCPIDDIVAVILVERWLATQSRES